MSSLIVTNVSNRSINVEGAGRLEPNKSVDVYSKHGLLSFLASEEMDSYIASGYITCSVGGITVNSVIEACGRLFGSAGTMNTRAQYITVPGELTLKDSSPEWYPPTSITLVDIYSTVIVGPTGGSLVISLKKNAVSFATITFTDGGALKIGPTVNTTTFTPTDALTVAITSIGSTSPGEDLSIRIRYTS